MFNENNSKQTNLLLNPKQTPRINLIPNQTTQIHSLLNSPTQIKPTFNKTNYNLPSKSPTSKYHQISCLPNQFIFQFAPYPQQQFIQIKNISNQPYKIKLSKLKSKLFRLISFQGSQDNITAIMVPGLGRKLLIQFMSSKIDEKQKIKWIGAQRSDGKQREKQLLKIEENLHLEVFDELKISSQWFTETIPIYVHSKMGEIKYQKLVDLQFIAINKLTRFTHQVYNDSRTEQISLSLIKQQPVPISDTLHFHPQQLTIKPMTSENIEFTLTPAQQGAYHHKILVSKGNLIMSPIEVIYTAGESGCWITFEDGVQRANDVDFGYGYFGKQKNITLIAVNNTSHYVEMKSKIRVGWRNHDMESVFQSPEQYGKQCSSTTVDISSKSIKLSPFSKQKFTLTSRPKLSIIQESKVIKYTKNISEQFGKGIKSNKKISETMEKYKIQDQQFRQCLVAEFVPLTINQIDEILKKEQPFFVKEKGNLIKKVNYKSLLGREKGKGVQNIYQKQQKRDEEKESKQSPFITTGSLIQNNILMICLKSRYSLPMVRISPVELSFGKVRVGSQLRIGLNVSNRNEQLQAHICFGKVLGVEIIPKQLILKPNQTKQINAFAKPSNIGLVNQLLKLTIEEKYIVELRVTYQGIIDQPSNQFTLTNNFTTINTTNEIETNLNNKIDTNPNNSNQNNNLNKSQIRIKQRQFYNSLHSYNKSKSNTKQNNSSQLLIFSDALQKLSKTCHNQLYSSSQSLTKTYTNHTSPLNTTIENTNTLNPTTQNTSILNRTAQNTNTLNRASSSPMMFNIRKNKLVDWNTGAKQKEGLKTAKEDRFINDIKNKSVEKDLPKNKNQSLLPTELSLPNNNLELNNNLINSNKNQSNLKIINQLEIISYEQHTKPTQSTNPSPIRLPSPVDSLYVTKKIDRYQPYQSTHNTRKLLKSKSSKQFLSSIIKRQPRNRRQAEQIMMELKGEELKMIKINSKTIFFGKVFVGSKVQKQFTIDNDTEYIIEVKLKQPNSQSQSQRLESQMLKQTDFNSQLIPPGTMGRFPINLWAKQCGMFQKPISYIINNHHEFHFLIEAEIELASLVISKNVLKMLYLDDVNEMWLRDSFGVRNDGNADVNFRIQQQYQNFTIQPSQGTVAPGMTFDVNVTYKAIQTVINAGENLPISTVSKVVSKPSSNNLSSALLQQNQQNFQEQRININIKNGVTLSLRVTFSPNIAEPRCIIKQQKINFGVMIVNKPKTKSFLIKNLSRSMTLFEIENSECAEFLSFDLTKGRLPPQSSKEINVTYKSSIIRQIQSSFRVICRGGLTINVPIMAESVAPNIRLLEEEYNFGDVCCGSAQVLCVNIINDSETMVELLLDMLDKKDGGHSHGMEYLFVSLKQQAKNVINHQQTRKHKRIPSSLTSSPNNNKITLFSNIPYNLNAQEQAIIDQACIEPQIHKLAISPKSVYQFHLVFKPKLPGYYEFQLPLYLENFIKNQLLEKKVTCFATEPKFVVQPTLVKFKKKIIDEKESEMLRPLMEFLTLKNSGDQELKWKIQVPSVSLGLNINQYQTQQGNITLQTNKSFPSTSVLPTSQADPHFAFHLQTTRGVVKPHSWQCINISFNPYEAGLYCYRVGLWIWNDQRGVYQQQAEIRLQGQGQYPMLMFDRRQVILPVVPLGIQSIAMFRVINQGYETISLKYRLQFYDLEGNSIMQGTNYYTPTNSAISTSNTPATNSLPEITLLFPEGTKMGLNKKELFILIKFISHKPISFTCKLELYDNTKDNRLYELPVSGTTDCSVLTIWPFLNDKENKYKFISAVWNSHSIQQQYFEQQSKQKSSIFGIGKQSKQSTIISVLPQSIIIQTIDTRSPIDKYHNLYDKLKVQHLALDCEIVRRWINTVLKDQKVAKFPYDLTKGPESILKMLTKLTGRKEFQQLNNLFNTMENSNTQLNNTQQQQMKTTNNFQGSTTFPNSVNTATTSPNPVQQLLIVPGSFSSKYEFYEYFIRLLKSMGCLLNHIRPQFLLSREQFLELMQGVPGWKHMAETYLKNYEVIHTEAWLILFYQIVNNFWYNTSKLKSALAVDKNYQKDQTSSSFASNCYSPTELNILKWIKGIYEKYCQFQDINSKCLSYGQDFKDCVALAYAVYEHIANPQKKRKALEGLITKPSTQNQRLANLKILYQLIQKVGLVPMIYEEQFPNIKQKQMFMLLYQLYEMLPQQLPKIQPIYFECNLGEKCVKFIEIKNTSNKAVFYWIKLEGSRDFVHEEKQSIKVEGKSVYKFKVSFLSRVSEQEVGYLTFLNKLQSCESNSATSGSTLVFELHSRIVGRKSIKKLQPICCPIYESQMIRIPVQNIYEQSEYGQFEIELFEEILSNTNDSKGSLLNKDNGIRMFQLGKLRSSQQLQNIQDQAQKDDLVQQSLVVTQTNRQITRTPNKKPTHTSTNTHNDSNQDQKLSHLQLTNFFLDIDSIKIKRGSSSFIELYFNPIVYSKIKCYLIFHDPLVGEFQYQIIGISEIPKALVDIKHPAILYTGIKEAVDISIPQNNNPMIKANLLVQQKSLVRTGHRQPKHQPTRSKQEQAGTETFKIQLNMDNKILSYVNFPNQFPIKSLISKQQIVVNEQVLSNTNKLRIECLFNSVFKDLCLDFLLINQQKTDVRRIRVQLNVASRPIMTQLIMKTTARVPIIQPIPIENSTNKDWKVKATLTQDQQGEDLRYMSLKEGERVLFKDMVIKRNVGVVIPPSTQMTTISNLQSISNTNTNNGLGNSQGLSLVFNPLWVCKVNSKLHIHNLTTNQQLVYYIKAICEEPVSQGHFMFRIRTGLQEDKTITIKNPYNGLAIYKIETDLPEITIQQKVTLSSISECTIPLSICGQESKKSIGYIKLTDQERNRFFWYTIVLDFYEQQIQQIAIDISCQLGERVQKTLQIKNPLDKKVNFTIQYPQNAFLVCDKQLEVDKQTTQDLKIIFEPKEIIQKTITIKIFNKLVGLFAYKLSLFTMSHKHKPNQTITSEVNKVSSTSIIIYNPLKHPINITSQLLTQSKFFEIRSPNSLPPLSSTEIILQFRPLEEGNYHCVVKVYGEQFQTKLYEIEGIGIKPFSIEKIQMKTQVGSSSLEIIKFKNPDINKVSQNVQIFLESLQFPHNYFTIVTEEGSANKWTTKVTDILALPIQFAPLEKGYFQSILYIRCGHYQWKYLIKGVTSGKIVEEIKDKIEGECRRQIVKIMKIEIPPYLKKMPDFSIEMLDQVQIQCSNTKILHMLKSWMHIKLQSQSKGSGPNTSNSQRSNKSEEQQLTLTLKFTPLQPFQEIIEFIIYSSKNQGSIRLSHRIKLVSKPSEPDQSIEIDINSIKKYKFEVNLEDNGVISKRGIPISCQMLKGDFVECRFKGTAEQEKNSNNLKTSHIQKGNINQIVEVVFSPNNVMLSSSKGKNRYSDVLMIFTEKSFWSCEVLFKLNTTWEGNKKI